MNTARLVISKVVNDDADEIVKFTNERKLNDAKKTVEKNLNQD